MRPEILSLVHRILGQGLRLRSLLRLHREPDEKFLEQEHTRLRALLSMADNALQFPDYAGDRPLGESDRYFLGVRYALTCWADEVVTRDAPEWVERWWLDKQLEALLFNRVDKSYLFWEQANLAEGRSEIDALEGYYLCVMLGFRGHYRDKPGEIEQWRARVEPRIVQALNEPWPAPNSRPPPKDYEPHLGRERFQRGLAVALIVAGWLIAAGLFLALRR